MESYCGYKVIEFIGGGTFSNVYLVEKNNKKYALKKFTDEISSDTFNELDVLSRISHPNIIKVHEMFLEENSCNPCLILELAEKDLRRYLILNTSMTVIQRYKMMNQLACALEYLHKNFIIHSDLKPQNILVKDNNVMISDFGQSKIYYKTEKSVERNSYDEIGSRWWRAPELFLFEEDDEEKKFYYDYKIDVWSLGLIFVQILNGNFLGSENLIDIEKIDNQVKDFAKDVVNEKQILSYLEREMNFPEREKLIDLLKGMLRINPKDRLSSTQIVDHPFFQNFRCVPGIYKEEIFDIKPSIKYNSFRKETWNKLRNNFNRKRLDILFQALDLYDRYASIIYPKNEKDNLLIATSCLTIFDILDDYTEEISGSLQDKICDILRKLNFTIFRPNLYMLYPDKADEIFDLLLEKGSPDEFSVEWFNEILEKDSSN